MKKILSILSAALLSISMLMSMTAYADGEASELIAKKGKITVDGKIGSGEWSDAPSITITPENSTVTVLADGAQVDDSLSVKISVKYDEKYIYFLEERSSKYIDTPHTEQLDHLVYRGDSTNIVLSMFVPNATEQEDKVNTCDFVFSPDLTDNSPDKTNPIFQFRATTFQSSMWSDLGDAYHLIASTVNTTKTASVTEIAVAWEKLFQGNSLHSSATKDYKKYIKQFAANEGFAFRFAAIVHEGNSNKEHEYTLAYGCNVLDDPEDPTNIYRGTTIMGDDITSWRYIYLGKKPADGQIDLAKIVEEAKAAEKDAEGQETLMNVLIWVGVAILAIAVVIFVVFRIFGIKLNFGSSDEDEEDEDEEDEEDEEYDEDEEE